MATEEELLSHGRVIVSTLVDHTPTHIRVHLPLAAPQSAPPVHLLSITAGADLRVPGGERGMLVRENRVVKCF